MLQMQRIENVYLYSSFTSRCHILTTFKGSVEPADLLPGNRRRRNGWRQNLNGFSSHERQVGPGNKFSHTVGPLQPQVGQVDQQRDERPLLGPQVRGRHHFSRAHSPHAPPATFGPGNSCRYYVGHLGRQPPRTWVFFRDPHFQIFCNPFPLHSITVVWQQTTDEKNNEEDATKNGQTKQNFLWGSHETFSLKGRVFFRNPHFPARAGPPPPTKPVFRNTCWLSRLSLWLLCTAILMQF